MTKGQCEYIKRYARLKMPLQLSQSSSYCIRQATTRTKISILIHRIYKFITSTSSNMLYAGYYNLSQAGKTSSGESSRRVSKESTASAEATSSAQKIKSGLKHVLEQLRPTTEPLTPAGIYSPVIKRGRLFSRQQSTSSSKVELIQA